MFLCLPGFGWGDTVDMSDKFSGVVYGTAIGDALGYPVEFMDMAGIRQRYGAAGVTGIGPTGRDEFGLACSLYSDDTQMFRAVCEGLLRSGSDLDAAAEEVAEEFIAWADSPENNRSPGAACLYGCRQLKKGLPWRLTGKFEGHGCGAAMRAAAYGLRWWANPHLAAEWAAAHTLMTHRSRSAQASAAAVAAGVAKGMVSGNWFEVAATMVAEAYQYDAATGALLNLACQKVTAGVPSTDVLHEWRGWRGDEAVAASLYCCLASRDFSSTVLLAVNSPGDSDSLGAIAGGLAGAVYGGGKIPADWIVGVERTEELKVLASRMWEFQTSKVLSHPMPPEDRVRKRG
jgi:ADP-ribosylglycohydrolase